MLAVVIVALHRPPQELSLAELLLSRQLPGRPETLSWPEWAYTALLTLARRLLSLVPQSHQTPFEFASDVSYTVPGSAESVDQIASAYVRERFSPRPAEGEAEELARSALIDAWLRLRPAVVRRWVEGWGVGFRSTRQGFDGRPLDLERWRRRGSRKDRGRPHSRT
jgi:hypothetical protein